MELPTNHENFLRIARGYAPVGRLYPQIS